MDTRILPGNTRKERRHNDSVRVTMTAIAEHAKSEVANYGDIAEIEKALISYIHLVGGMTTMNARPDARHPDGYYGLALEYGRLWTPQSLPPQYKRGTMKECFSNALHLALDEADLTYVEGYAHSPLLPTAHAWCVDQFGNVVDPTWDNPENSAYFGIAFDTEFALNLVHKQGYYGLLGNDWTNDAQMIRLGLVMHDQGDHSVAIAVGEE